MAVVPAQCILRKSIARTDAGEAHAERVTNSKILWLTGFICTGFLDST